VRRLCSPVASTSVGRRNGVSGTVNVAPEKAPRPSVRTRVTAQGTGFQPGERVEIRFFTDLVARVRTDGRGAFSGATFTVPDTPFRRPTEVLATGEQSLRTATTNFTVQ
jgi:hypothetical protein